MTLSAFNLLRKTEFPHVTRSNDSYPQIDRVTLWTTGNFLAGSNALATGYFLRNFLLSIPALACYGAPRATASAF
jgi:hypothetical protein